MVVLHFLPKSMKLLQILSSCEGEGSCHDLMMMKNLTFNEDVIVSVNGKS